MKAKLNLIVYTGILLLIFSCSPNRDEQITTHEVIPSDTTSQPQSRIEINTLLDSFNIAAANAEYTTYFNYFSDDAVFIGTDATENWNKSQYMLWSKPYFDKKETWNFKALERHIFFDKTGSLAWFDELLETQMKICRGSGVLVKEDNSWKIKQYVLSMTFPNSEIDSVLKIKGKAEDQIIAKMKSK
ncbi:MAG: nuclear transport factor 2 family protein [Bacteroidetes bacterium]|nr:nuclear transport factor 2 family protein [Bacteroidota bacterium]